MRWVIVGCVSLVACRGEQVGEPLAEDAASVDSAAADTAVDTAVTGDTSAIETSPPTDGGCPTGKANLLVNGDFESWAGSTPDGFGINADAVSVEPLIDDAGTKFARVTITKTGNGPVQTVSLPEPLPKGCKIYLSGRARYVSGPTAPTPDLFMYMYDSAGMNPPGTGGSFASYTTSWSSHTAVFTTDRTVVKVEAYVLGNATSGVQVFDVDDLVLSYSPP